MTFSILFSPAYFPLGSVHLFINLVCEDKTFWGTISWEYQRFFFNKFQIMFVNLKLG